MADNKNNDSDSKNNTDGVDDSEEENEILEESPCGRWLKRREQVEQRDIPGIDATYLAMDTEEGVEVVWNEVRFSERKYFKTKEETINEVFDRLIQLEHPNIVKLHKYWVHKDVEKPRVIFITEYMSSGSLKTFLRKTKKNLIRMALNAWKKWCTQTLSALCYLHSSLPPIVHGNLNCDTIFISYNGLIKIGAVAPDAIHKHVKTVRGDSKANVHFIAPEIGCISDIDGTLSPSVDIYSFGMCALEMAALEISPNGESSHITDDVINHTIESLDNRLQKDFITKCLNKNPNERPTARELLFHPIIFEVPSLKLFSAHVIVNTTSFQPEQLTEEAIYRVLCLQNSNDKVLAEIQHNDGRPNVALKKSDSPKVEFEKFFEEVQNGAFPLTAIVTTTRPPLISRQRTISPEVSGESTKPLNSPENAFDEETRRILNVTSTLEPPSEANTSDKRLVITLHIIFDDEINRKLSTKLELIELIPSSLAQELVFYGFVNKDDHNIVSDLLSEIKELFISSGNQSVNCQKSQQLSPLKTTQHSNVTQVLSQQSKPVVTQQQIPTQSTKQSTPQPIKETVQQPIQQPIAQLSQQQVQQSLQQPIQQLVVQPVQQTVQQSVQQPVLQPIKQAIQQSVQQPIQQPLVQQPVQQPVVQQSVQQPIQQQPVQQPIQQSVEQQSAQQPVVQPVQLAVQHSVQQHIAQPVQPPIQQSVQQPIHQPIYQSVQQPIQLPITQAIQKPIRETIPVVTPKLESVSQTASKVVLQPTVGPQLTSQQTIRTQIPAQTQTPTQTIPQQIKAPQQVSQQSTQPQTQQMSPSVASQTVGPPLQIDKKTMEEQRPVV